ncbi:MAG: hypothetical protein AMXMBFR4_33010 [Candidatus Hydrogenedentota bacterium]
MRIQLYDDKDVIGHEIGATPDGQINLDYVYKWARKYTPLGLAKVYAGNTPSRKFSIELSSEGFRAKTFVFQTFTLHSPPDVDLRVLGLEFDERYLDVRVEPVLNARKDHEVMVSVARDIPYGSFVEPILIRTTDPFEPDKRVSVKGNVLLPLLIEPRHITLGMLRAGQVKVASIRLSSPYGIPLEIVKLEVKEGYPLSATVNPISSTEVELLLTVSVDGEQSAKVFKAVISVVAQIGTAQERELIEVYGIFQE